MRSKLRYLLLSVLILLSGVLCPAQEQPRLLRYGVEWGASTTIATYYHYNYLDNMIGYRIDDSGMDYDRFGNAFVTAYCGLDVSRRIGVSLRSGLTGIQRGRRIVPLTVRGSWYPHGTDADGLFALVEAGLGFPDFFDAKPVPLSFLGGGYRYRLGDGMSVDVQLSWRGALDHPEIWDEQERHYILPQNIRRNDAWHSALVLSVALNF